MSGNKSAFEMSDEDFLNSDPSEFEEEASDQAEETETDEEETTETEDQEEEQDESEDEEESSSDDDEEDSEEDEEVDSKKEDESADSSDEDEEEKTDASKQQSSDMSEAQFAAIGRQIMGEFKANGSVIKMKSAEDAIRLMQMGANYHKKMAGLKPSLKVLKLLENNDLLDSEKLNYLIDLSQKKPEAITKLLRDSEIDPLDLDVKGEDNYKPSTRTVNDTELALDDVLESISSSQHYDRTLTVLGDDWDNASRAAIADQPEIIRTINAHMENGIFDQVMEQVEYDRRLGKLQGISDFEAYQQTGQYMHENKLFRAPESQQSTESSQRQDDQQSNNDEQARQQEARKSRKKAASPSRQRQAPAKKDTKYDPLAMSDEEFAKLNQIQL